jgi:hypothetical protein
VLFGLPGVRVVRVEQVEFGEGEVHVETAEESASGCPSCGVVSRSVKQYVTTAPRDLPYGETGISVVWHKRRWRCVEPSCRRLSFTEAIEEVPAGQRTTGRLRRAMACAVGDACRSVAEVAGYYGVSWPTAHAAVVLAAQEVLREPEPTEVLGIDETRRGRPRWAFSREAGRWVRTDAWDTGFVDLAGEQGLLGQVSGRTSACVVGLAAGADTGVPRGDPVRGDRPGCGVCQGDPHRGAFAQRDPGGRSFPSREAGQRRGDQGPAPGDLGAQGPPRTQDRPGLGQPTQAAHRLRTPVGARLSRRCGTR